MYISAIIYLLSIKKLSITLIEILNYIVKFAIYFLYQVYCINYYTLYHQVLRYIIQKPLYKRKK